MQEHSDDVQLKVVDLCKNYEGRVVLDHTSFHVNKGEVVGLIGPNGAGKTTAFYAVIGLVRPEKGEVYFQGSNICKLPTYKRARIGMGFLAQEPSVFRDMSVEENLIALLEFQNLSTKECRKRIKEALCELDLFDLRKKNASVLSGGQRRRLEIARCLVNRPSFILLDEPFANVDPLTIQGVKKMISHLASKKISILITDHNAREIFQISDRCYLLSSGQVLASGTPQELASDPIVKERYLGHDFEW